MVSNIYIKLIARGTIGGELPHALMWPLDVMSCLI